jgi:hypothetical protein
MRAVAILAMVVALGGIGCASTGVGAGAVQQDLASAAVDTGPSTADDLLVAQLLRQMHGDRVAAVLDGRPLKLSADEGVLLAQIYATYGSKKAARGAIHRALSATELSAETVAASSDPEGLAGEGDRTARR